MSLPKNKPTITFKPQPINFSSVEEALIYHLEKWLTYRNWTSNGACRLVLAKCRKDINDIFQNNIDIFFALHDDEYNQNIALICGIVPAKISVELKDLWDYNKDSLVNLSLY